MTRPLPRLAWSMAALVSAWALPGCGSSPPVQLYQLRLEPPVTVAPAAPVGADARAAQVWAVGPVSLPDYLDRDAIVRPVGRAGLSAATHQRWAEPLRDVLPRLLVADLSRLRGAAQVWRAPAPAGAGPARSLRVEILRLDAREDGMAVVLQARWSLLDPSGASPALVQDTRIEAPCADTGTDALAAAHRLAVWRLAEDIVARTAAR